MNGKQDEAVGKVFVVVGGKRRCLICERIFTPTEAAAHAVAVCRPSAGDCGLDRESCGEERKWLTEEAS